MTFSWLPIFYLLSKSRSNSVLWQILSNSDIQNIGKFVTLDLILNDPIFFSSNMFANKHPGYQRAQLFELTSTKISSIFQLWIFEICVNVHKLEKRQVFRPVNFTELWIASGRNRVWAKRSRKKPSYPMAYSCARHSWIRFEYFTQPLVLKGLKFLDFDHVIGRDMLSPVLNEKLLPEFTRFGHCGNLVCQ